MSEDVGQRGYFSPESAIWRIGRESVLMLGGGYALLMQAAHPLVAAGIVAHSSFRESPWRRLAGTMNAIFQYIEVFHNGRRRHSSLDMLTPIEFELLNTAKAAA